MANYHFAIKTSEKCKASANLHHEYICREGKYEYISREGKFEKSEKAAELVYKEHGNMPEWAKTPNEFWRAANIYEAGNRTSYREIELSLPNELSEKEQLELVHAFVGKHLGKDFVYSLAIHSNEARLSKTVEAAFNESSEYTPPAVPVKNPHVHLMFCERKLDEVKRDAETFFRRANSTYPERGGAIKDRRWNGNERSHHLKMLREDWAILQNKALEKAKQTVRVDHRSLKVQKIEAEKKGDRMKAQELDRIPEKPLGPKFVTLRNHPSVKQIIASREYRKSIQVLHDQYLNPQSDIPKIKQVKKQEYLFTEYNNVLNKVKDMDHLINQNAASFEVYKMSHDLLSECKMRMENINKEIDRQRESHRFSTKKIISPQRAKIMAISIFTYGEYTQLNQEARKLKLENDRYIAQEKSLKDQLKVSSNLLENADFSRKLAKIEILKNAIQVKSSINSSKRIAIIQDIRKPLAKDKLSKIEYNILQKNKPHQVAATQIYDDIRSLIYEKENLTHLLNKVNQINQDSKITDSVRVDIIEKQMSNRQLIIDRLKETNSVKNTNDQIHINLTIKEMKEICNIRLQELRDQAEPFRQEMINAGKKVISPERAYSMAINNYTKGLNKELVEEKRKIEKLEEKYQERERAFNGMVKPKFYQITERLEYEKEASVLINWKKQLKSQKENNKLKINALMIEIEKPEVKLNINKRQAAILEKNKPQKEAYEKLKADYHEIKSEREKIMEFKKQIQPYEKVRSNSSIINSDAGSANGKTIAPVDLIKQASNIINQLKNNMRDSNVGLTARVKDDDESVRYRL